MKKLEDDIKNRKFERVYLFFGDENYLKKTYTDKLRKALVSDGAEMMNLDIFQGKKPESKKILDSCETFPFMNDFRLVIVKDSELFIQGSKEESEKIAGYVKSIPKSSILMFIEDKVDKRGKLYKTVSQNGYCVECKIPSEKEMCVWVEKKAKEKGLVMKKDVVLYFLRSVNIGMESALAELEKLSDYVGEGEILKRDVDEVCAKSLEVKIFNMVAAIGNKKLKDALDIYNNMILMKESPIMILAMIARQFRIILQSKYLAEKGFYNADIAKKINQREFVVSQCLSQAKNFRKKDLLKALDDCLKCGANIKTGKIQDKLGVEMIIMKYGV